MQKNRNEQTTLGSKEASSLDQINMTENGLKYDQKISHWQTLTIEHDQKYKFGHVLLLILVIVIFLMIIQC